jgi:antitoxin component of MazEF toxin-antitoxin module
VIIKRKLASVPGGLAVVIPKDFAEAMKLSSGDAVDLFFCGRTMTLKAEDRSLDEPLPQKAKKTKPRARAR